MNLSVKSYPEGIVSVSPGLRGTSYPGSQVANISNPERVASCGSRFDATPLGLTDPLTRIPRVARSSQPWAGGRSPVGAAESGAPQPQRRRTPPELAAVDVRAPVAKFMVPTRGRSDSGVLRSSAPPRLIHHVRTA